MSWYECRIRYVKDTESSVNKKTTETYMVEALSHAEAEILFATEIKPFVSGENEILSIRKLKISEMMFSQSDTWWYNAKVSFISFDEKSGTERRSNVKIMVQGDDMGSALGALQEGLNGTLVDYEITCLSKSNIMEVFTDGCKETGNQVTK